jgi:hypothetical protein
VNISGIFTLLFAHWSDCVDRNDKVFTLLYKIVMHKKVSHPDEIQNTLLINNTKVIMSNEAYLEDSLMWFSFVWETLPK